MQADLQSEADRKLTEALRKSGARDPRDDYRALLRELKTRGEAAYEEAVADYRTGVVEAIAEHDADPIPTWLEYGCRLVERLRPGRSVVLDGAGRATPYEPPPTPDALILHLPEAKGRAFVIGAPGEMSRAQRAAVDLLAHGKVREAVD